MPGEAQPNSVTENTASPLDLSRRDFVATGSAAAGGFALAPGSARAATVGTDIANLPPYGNGRLPPGIRSRPIANVNGLTVHILEAGYEVPGRPAVLLLHGFPELAYSWRKVMLPLAATEYHVIAPDQRGYGRTTGWDDSYDADPDPFRILNVHVVAVPAPLIKIHPEWRGHMYFVVGDQIIIVDRNHRIIAIINV